MSRVATGAATDTARLRQSVRNPGRRRPARQWMHWALNHGLPRVATRRAAGRGDLQAAFIMASLDGGDVSGAVADIRASGPMAGGLLGWVTAEHELVRQVLTSPDFRTGIPIHANPVLARIDAWARPDRLHPLEAPSLLATEPPDHTRYRKLATSVFTARAVRRLEEGTVRIADELVARLADRAAAGEPVDLVEEYCAPLPVAVISEILGVEPHDQGLLLRLGSDVAASLDFGLSRAAHARVESGLAEFDRWLTRHLSHLRRHPGDNLLSDMVSASVDDGQLDERELKATAGLILAAGFETTVNLLGNGIRLLHDHPRALARVRAQPHLWGNVSEEVLRLDPPVLMTGRMAARNTELGGQEVVAGQFVTALIGGANRDPRVFEDPDTFDVGRPNAGQHLSFSAGRHHCLGASLARMEGEIGLRTLFDRFEDLRLLPGAERRTTRVLRGWRTLPARLA